MFISTKFFTNLFSALFIVLLAVVIPLKGHAMEANDSFEAESLVDYMDEIINWKKENTTQNRNAPLLNDPFLEQAGETAVDWYTIGLGRIGVDDDYSAYLAVIKDVVENRYQTDEKLSSAKATEWHRISLAILAAGGDPTKIGKTEDGKVINLIADGTYARGETTRSLGAQGLNGWIWGLITLDSMRYIVPEDANETRQSMITEILRHQLTDGGFALHIEPTSDVDMTAMAIQALAPYYNSEETYTYTQIATDETVKKKVREVVDEALTVLSNAQKEDGGFESHGISNAESIAQVIVALTALGVDPLKDERFIKQENTLLDALLKFQMSDGGFIHSEIYDEENPMTLPDESNAMASEQVLYTFAAMYRYYYNYRTLYDFREEMSMELKEKITASNQSIEAIPENPDSQLIQRIFSDYLEIPIEERSYVYNYYQLAEAMDNLGIDNTSEPLAENMGINNDGKGTIISLINEEKTIATDAKFTEEDARHVAQIADEEKSTEHYVEVVKLIEKLDNATNAEEYEHLGVDLQEIKSEIENIEEEIQSINETILDELYPFSNVTSQDKEIVENIITRYQQLSPYDQEKVQGYEDVERAEIQIKNGIRSRYIGIAISVLIVGMSFLLISRYRKRKREKMQQNMIVDEEA